MRFVQSKNLPFRTRRELQRRYDKRIGYENLLDRLAFNARQGYPGAEYRFFNTLRYVTPAARIEELDWYLTDRKAYWDRFGSFWMRNRGLKEVGSILSMKTVGAPGAAEAVIAGAFHVDPDDTLGESASDSNDGILAADGGSGPWLTLEHAISQLSPSGGVGDNGYDVCYLRQGTYTRAATGFTDISSGGSNDTGYSGSKIRMLGYPGETATIDWSAGISNTIRHQSGGGNWSWEDLTWTCNHGGVIAGNTVSAAPGVHFKRITQPLNAWGGNADNTGIMRCDYEGGLGTGMLIEDCDLDGSDNTHANGSCVFLEQLENYWIRRSILRQSGDGQAMYIKHPQLSTTADKTDRLIEYTLIFADTGIDARNGWRNQGNTSKVSHCIVSCGAPTGGGAFAGGDGGNDGAGINYAIEWDHVTFYGGVANYIGNTSDPNGKDNSFTNCVFTSNLTMASDLTAGTHAHNTTLDYNAHASGTTLQEYHQQSHPSPWASNLADWITHYGGSSNSVQGSIVFANTVVDDDPSTYALDPTSAGYQDADDSTDCGADTSLVGPS